MTANPISTTRDDIAPSTPTGRVLTGSLVVAPLVSLAADSTYAVRGWDDPIAAIIHVIGAVGYGLVVLRIVSWSPPASKLAVVILVLGLGGFAGNVAYGFDAIHASLGDVPLVDQPGAANLIKPLGLLLPISFALTSVALLRLGSRWRAVLLLAASIAWPMAHIGNIAPLAVVTNCVLVLVFGTLVWDRTSHP